MVDRIQKALDKLTPKEKIAIKKILLAIQNGRLDGLDVKKLQGHENIYRVRKGKMRIIYRLEVGEIFVLAVEKRSETTYSGF